MIRTAIYDFLEQEHPATDRGTFYNLVHRAVLAKTEAEYKRTVVRLLGVMRRSGEIPFAWIADSTRWMRKPTTYNSLRDMLERERSFYRQALWTDQEAYVEIWLEKDALSGVLYEVTSEWDVPLMVTRGYASLSFLHSAAQQIEAIGKPAWIYYFGDWDPSGRDITRATEDGLREFAPNAEIHFERVAVTEEQIERLSLPTRPTKTSDPRAINFEGDSVEVDAIPPTELRRICKKCITRHIDTRALRITERIEEQERKTLDRILAILPSFGGSAGKPTRTA